MKVKLEPGIWLAYGDGECPRTTNEIDAREFISEKEALIALSQARKVSAFEKAEIYDDFF